MQLQPRVWPGVSVAVACLGIVAGCGDPTPLEAEGVTGSTLASDNGLSSNGLSSNGMSANGLSGNGLSGNGLSNNGLSANGLSANGLSASGFAAWFNSGNNDAKSRAYAAQLMNYLVRCACPSSETRQFTDPVTKTAYSWQGALGLAPQWCGSASSVAPATTKDQEWVTACLLAHVNTLATDTGAPQSVQISVGVSQTNADRMVLAASGEERSALAVDEGVYFGNLFNQQSGGQKGAYAGRAKPAVRFFFKTNVIWGRTCYLEGCGDNITFAGDSMPSDGKDPWFPTYTCSSNSNCTGVNDGKTPTCDLREHVCVPKEDACSRDAYTFPISCKDTSARNWSRVLFVRTPALTEAEANNSIASTATLKGGAKVMGFCDDCSNEAYVSGLSNGGATETFGYNVLTTSSLYKINVRYQGAGKLEVSTAVGGTTAPTAWVSCGVKNLSCAYGQWCWATWEGCSLRTAGNNNKQWTRIAGVAGSTAPDVDVYTLGAMH